MTWKTISAAAGVAVLVAISTPVFAQTPTPYPPGTSARCVRTFDAADRPDTSFAPGEAIGINGDPGCAAANETGVEFIFSSDPVILARKNAASDGSYSVETRIPTNATPGAHRIIVRTRAATYEQPITITGAAAGSGLPRTGADIALLAAWGVSVLLFGSLLIVATWKRYRLARTEASHAPIASGPQMLSADDLTNFQPTRRPIVVDTSYADNSEDLAPIVNSTAVATVEPTSASVVAEPEPEPLETSEAEVEPKASSETSELIGRLEQEIAAWSKK